ncbi:hypothetical protein IW143_003864, partial [Coemansia sp. RSA 520]
GSDEDKKARLMSFLDGYESEDKHDLPPNFVEFLLALSYEPGQNEQSVQDFINSLQVSTGTVVDNVTHWPVTLLDLDTSRLQ